MFGVNTNTNMALPSIKQKTKIRQPAINSLRVKTITFEHFLDYYFFLQGEEGKAERWIFIFLIFLTSTNSGHYQPSF